MEFRKRGKSFLLTYKNINGSYNCESLKILLLDKLKNHSNLKYVIVNEISDSEYNHFHVWLIFEKTLDIKSCIYFDLDLLHPNIRSVNKKLVRNGFDKELMYECNVLNVGVQIYL